MVSHEYKTDGFASFCRRMPAVRQNSSKPAFPSSLPDFFGIDQFRESEAEGTLQHTDRDVTAAQDFHVGQVYHDSALSKKWTKKADGFVLPEQMISCAIRKEPRSRIPLLDLGRNICPARRSSRPILPLATAGTSPGKFNGSP